MPRTQGVSSSCTVWLIRRRPKPRIVSRCDCLVPIRLLICVTLIVLACVMTYPRISSTFLPRLAAISDGEFIAFRPFSVARTTLYGLLEPIHLASTSRTPTASNTARIAPPAIMPVPSDAGCISTLAAPCLPITVWCSVPFFRLILARLRRASSIAFCTATGTSLDLPLPIATRPSPSPTTVRAANPMIRPPLTTLVTRLTEIIFSIKPSSRSSCCCIFPCGLAITQLQLELQTMFPRSFSKRLDTAMIPVTGTIKRNLIDARTPGFFSDTLAHHRRSRLVASVRQILANLRFDAGRAGQYFSAAGRNHLGINVQVCTVNCQAYGFLLGNACAGLASSALARFFLDQHISLNYFCLKLLLFGFFQNHHFIAIPHTLTLVRLGLAESANFGGNLSDTLLIGALQHNFSLGWSFDLDTGRHLVGNRVRITKRQIQGIAGRLRTITHADQSQLALKTFAHTQHHVGQQGADGAGHRIGLHRVILCFAQQAVALAHYAHFTRQGLLKGTQRALYRNFTRRQRDFRSEER